MGGVVKRTSIYLSRPTKDQCIVGCGYIGSKTNVPRMGNNPRNSRCDIHQSAMPTPDIHSEESGESHTPVQRAVLLFLERRGPSPIDEIITAIDSHPIAVETACSDLQRAGVLCTRSCGVYAVSGDKPP